MKKFLAKKIFGDSFSSFFSCETFFSGNFFLNSLNQKSVGENSCGEKFSIKKCVFPFTVNFKQKYILYLCYVLFITLPYSHVSVLGRGDLSPVGQVDVGLAGEGAVDVLVVDVLDHRL